MLGCLGAPSSDPGVKFWEHNAHKLTDYHSRPPLALQIGLGGGGWLVPTEGSVYEMAELLKSHATT